MKMTYRSVIASSTLPRGIFFQTVGFEDLLAMSRCQGSDWRIENILQKSKFGLLVLSC